MSENGQYMFRLGHFKTTSSGKKQIKIGGWMYGKIGSGGEEFLFNTHHGDVVIRKL